MGDVQEVSASTHHCAPTFASFHTSVTCLVCSTQVYPLLPARVARRAVQGCSYEPEEDQNSERRSGERLKLLKCPGPAGAADNWLRPSFILLPCDGLAATPTPAQKPIATKFHSSAVVLRLSLFFALF